MSEAQPATFMIVGSDIDITPQMVSEYVASWSSLSPQDSFAKQAGQMYHGDVNSNDQDVVSHGHVNLEHPAENITFITRQNKTKLPD